MKQLIALILLLILAVVITKFFGVDIYLDGYEAGIEEGRARQRFEYKVSLGIED